jgi:two-component system, OmpR family, phosphate regulon sensor histidine kinase PhoR
MRTIESFFATPSMRDRKLNNLVAQESQITIVGMLGHKLRQSLQVI